MTKAFRAMVDAEKCALLTVEIRIERRRIAALRRALLEILDHWDDRDARKALDADDRARKGTK